MREIIKANDFDFDVEYNDLIYTHDQVARWLKAVKTYEKLDDIQSEITIYNAADWQPKAKAVKAIYCYDEAGNVLRKYDRVSGIHKEPDLIVFNFDGDYEELHKRGNCWTGFGGFTCASWKLVKQTV